MDSPLPPKDVPAAGQLLDLPPTLPGYVYRRHAGFCSSSPRQFLTPLPVHQLVEIVGAAREFWVSSR